MATTVSQPNKIGSVFDLATKSAQIVKENWQMFAVVYVFSILSAVMAMLGADNDKDNRFDSFSSYDSSGLLSGAELAGVLGFGLLLAVIFIAVSVFLYAMKTGLEVRAARGEKPDFNTLVSDGKKYWLRLVGVTLLSGLIVIVGLILLIIPGLIAIVRLIMAPYNLVDKNLGVMDAIKTSNNQAKGRASYIVPALLLAIVVSIAASVIGAVPIVGPLVALVVSVAYSLIIVLRYFEIKRLPAIPAGK